MNTIHNTVILVQIFTNLMIELMQRKSKTVPLFLFELQLANSPIDSINRWLNHAPVFPVSGLMAPLAMCN